MVIKNPDGTFQFKNGTVAIKDINGNFRIVDKIMKGGKKTNYTKNIIDIYNKHYETPLNENKKLKDNSKNKKVDEKLTNNTIIILKLLENPESTIEIDIVDIYDFENLSQKAQFLSKGIFYNTGHILVPKFLYKQKYFDYFKEFVKTNKGPYWFSNDYNHIDV